MNQRTALQTPTHSSLLRLSRRINILTTFLFCPLPPHIHRPSECGMLPSHLASSHPIIGRLLNMNVVLLCPLNSNTCLTSGGFYSIRPFWSKVPIQQKLFLSNITGVCGRILSVCKLQCNHSYNDVVGNNLFKQMLVKL